MWRAKKFAVAVRGIVISVRDHNSFWAHGVVSLLVLSLAALLQVESWRWMAVVFAITLVWTSELLNSALEELVKAIHPQPDARIGRSLDAAAGAVLVASVGAVAIGLLSLGEPLWAWFFAMI